MCALLRLYDNDNDDDDDGSAGLALLSLVWLGCRQCRTFPRMMALKGCPGTVAARSLACVSNATCTEKALGVGAAVTYRKQH